MKKGNIESPKKAKKREWNEVRYSIWRGGKEEERTGGLRTEHREIKITVTVRKKV